MFNSGYVIHVCMHVHTLYVCIYVRTYCTYVCVLTLKESLLLQLRKDLEMAKTKAREQQEKTAKLVCYEYIYIRSAIFSLHKNFCNVHIHIRTLHLIHCIRIFSIFWLHKGDISDEAIVYVCVHAYMYIHMF